ncbi:MAG: hypothetical protein IPK19_23300, partial [Chloroflexi bacterium]|nr:hypothetical protein [Chloroflexota bacterium]
VGVANTTFSSNPGGSGGGLYAVESAIVIENSLLANTTCGVGTGGSITGTNNVATPGSNCLGVTEYAELHLGPLATTAARRRLSPCCRVRPAIDAETTPCSRRTPPTWTTMGTRPNRSRSTSVGQTIHACVVSAWTRAHTSMNQLP